MGESTLGTDYVDLFCYKGQGFSYSPAVRMLSLPFPYFLSFFFVAIFQSL